MKNILFKVIKILLFKINLISFSLFNLILYYHILNKIRKNVNLMKKWDQFVGMIALIKKFGK
jgi:hypothetical protein